MGQGVSQLGDETDHDNHRIPTYDSSLHDREQDACRDQTEPLSSMTDGPIESTLPQPEQDKAGTTFLASPKQAKEPQALQATSPLNSPSTQTTPRRLKKRQSDYQSLCRMKKARNEARLKELGFMGGSLLRSHGLSSQNPSAQTISAKSATDDDPKDTTSQFHYASRNFPHRKKQIRQLSSLLCGQQTIVPLPIFVYGPKGSAKSSIVLHTIEKHCENAAYVDCSSFLYPSKTPQNNSAILQAIYDHFATYRAVRSISSPWKLHLELQEESLGASSRRIVVLDHADCLTIDFLRQLFFLPHFVWIVVTRSSLMSLSIEGICPVTVHFGAYKNRDEVRDILRDDYVRQMITGLDSFNSMFTNDAYLSFVDSLTQANAGSDIRALIRKGRQLWPRYIEPLHPTKIHCTFSAMATATPTKTDVIGHLDLLMLPHWRQSANVDPLNFPKLGKYLLLASFICQSNHRDADKRLFLMERNGRRRRNTETTVIQQRSSRSSFPLERLFSVYVSIVSLNEPHLAADGDLEFFDRLNYFRDLGILQPKGQGWACTISSNKAYAVASSVNFALQDYVQKPEK